MSRTGCGAYRALVVAALLCGGSASAQYTADGPEDRRDAVGVRYFGSAKDERGAYVADTSFLFETAQASFVFVTDATGRFRGMLPLDTASKPVAAKCWKAGFETVRINRRPGSKSGRVTQQFDCVLRPSASG